MFKRFIRFCVGLMLLAALCVMQSCGGSRSNADYFSVSDDEEEEGLTYHAPATDTLDLAIENYSNQLEEADTTNPEYGDVAIPFVEAAGVKYINVEINGSIGVRMIVDSGCSSTLISLAEAQYLAEKGVFTEDDILGSVESQIADGSITVDTQVCLRQIVLDDKLICTNVIAVVTENTNAPLLLGNEVLNRVGAYTVDNNAQEIVFHNVPLIY